MTRVVRRAAARALERGCGHPIVTGLAIWMLRLSGRRAGMVVMYHRIGRVQGDAEREFTPALSVAVFDAQLHHLRRHYRVVAPEDVRDAGANRRRGRRFPVGLTFDDDTTSHVDHAAPTLRRHGVPATFFLNGLALDTPRAYWWERLQTAHAAGATWDELLPEGALVRAQEIAEASEVNIRALEVSLAVEELSAGDRAELARTLLERLGADPADAGLRAHQVRALADEGFTVGFHGHHHEPMSLLSDAALDDELDGGRDALAAAAGTAPASIAYPHGRADRRVAEAARARGFTAGFTVREEAVTPAGDPLLQGRIDGFAASPGPLAVGIVRALWNTTS